MKTALLLAGALLVSTGCDQQYPAAENSVTDAPVAPAQALPESGTVSTEEAAPCEQTGYSLLPPGIVMTFPRHLRADRFHVNQAGQQRRRVTFEYLQGDVESTLASVAESLVAAGYEARPRRMQENGNILAPFVKEGAEAVLVVANQMPGDAPSHPQAKGVVVLDYESESVVENVVGVADE